MKIQFGDRVKNSINGYSGIVMARAKYANGCQTVAIQSESLDKDGQPLPLQWFNVEEVVLIESAVFVNIADQPSS